MRMTFCLTEFLLFQIGEELGTVRKFCPIQSFLRQCWDIFSRSCQKRGNASCFNCFCIRQCCVTFICSCIYEKNHIGKVRLHILGKNAVMTVCTSVHSLLSRSDVYSCFCNAFSNRKHVQINFIRFTCCAKYQLTQLCWLLMWTILAVYCSCLH